jgi:hypothetical protein
VSGAEARRRQRRRLAAALVVLVALVAADVGLQLAIGGTTRSRDRALQEQAAAEARLAGLEAELVAADDAATRQRTLARLTAARADHSTSVTGGALARTEEDRAALATAATDAVSASAHLEELRAMIATSTTQIGELRTCLDGVSAAGRAAGRGDTAGAIAALQGVADACRAAEAATEQIDPTVRFAYDFPDPFVVAADGGYYAYATNSAGGAVQLLRSTDLRSWAFAGTALSGVPGWAVPGATWAPSVLRRPGGWVLYYAVRDRASGRQCISAASAAGPTGPFVDDSAGPLVCELDQGGSIDASPFVAPDGAATLLWKSEGETAGGGATLRAAPLAADGRSLTGPSVVLLGVSQGWEGRTVEGPSMAATPAGFVLLYSANRWDTGSYAVGAATCSSPLGPCTKVAGPILATDGPMVGPGGAEAFVDAAGAVRVAFHAWQSDDVGYPEHRYLHIGRLVTAGGIGIEVQ